MNSKIKITQLPTFKLKGVKHTLILKYDYSEDECEICIEDDNNGESIYFSQDMAKDVADCLMQMGANTKKE